MRILNNYLVFKSDTTPPIPGLKEVQGWFAVPFTLQNATILRNMGLDAPSPITVDYKWAGKYKPYMHQMTTAEHFTLNKRCFCENSPGSGKTLSALWAADYLMTQGVVNRCLIISPLSTLSDVWGREIFINFPNRTNVILHGAAAKRLQLLKEKCDFYVVNHHGVAVITDALNKRPDINLVIIDEVAFYRSATGKNKVSWTAAKNILTADRWAWGMTGTPTPNAPTDAYGLVKLIRPENVPFSFTRFKTSTMMQLGPFKWVPRACAEKMVRDIIKPSIRYALRDCIDLPPTIVHYRHVEMTNEQKMHYKKLLKECVTEARGVQVTAVNAAVLMMRLIQASCGCMYSPNKELVKIDCGTRIDAVEEIAGEFGGKIILFVPFTGALHMVKAELEKRGYGCGLIEGATSQSERQRVFDAFRTDPEMRFLTANASTMSHGVNLTAAATTVWYSPVTSNEVYQQANARFVRAGQTQVTNIVNLSATKEEMSVYKALKNRTRFQDLVLSMVAENI